ncbi:hypothetical protein LUZ62_024102 [Rhynchospora pubera]|uniref:Uncharacterized protein n=1 Tax=Rhynchospora pubera TaxID=906938 RepID=A0AAV8H5W2_9POAL|nr:hypothetical protein LUZ62_024102 [Rhynchospora pubera]
MQALSVPMEGPLSLPCCSHSAAGIRAPPVNCKLLFTFESRPSSLSSKCSISRLFQMGFWSVKHQHARKATVVRAAENPGGTKRPVAPVRLQSPTGQLLEEIMRSHPYLLAATIDQQLERLQAERDAQKEEDASKPPGDLLYKRIAELKDKERRKEIEDIMYCLIVQKFMDRDISMIPKLIASSSPDVITQIDTIPHQESKLESVHSSDALEMIQSHLSIILGERLFGPPSTIVQMSKLKLGKLYAASIMYGYFLKRVDERYQLERSMNTLPNVRKLPNMFNDVKPNPFWDLESLVQITPDDGDRYGEGGDAAEKDSELRSYVMYLDPETLQRYATIRSKEAVAVIEKQTQALFGQPDIVVADDGSLGAVNDEIVTVTFQGLTMLILEAAAFGSFLWDSEGYVESKYHIFDS